MLIQPKVCVCLKTIFAARDPGIQIIREIVHYFPVPVTIKNVSKTDSRMANIHAEPLTDIDNLTIEGYHHKTRSSQEPLALLGAVKNLTLRDVSLDRSISIVERRFRDYNQDHGN